jgi:hypothetical protein
MMSKESRVSRELRDIVFGILDGMAACRDVPESIITVARKRFLMSKEELADHRWHGGYREVESAFGINDKVHHKFFPASAYQGPFFHLLRHSTDVGLDFIIEFANATVDWYGKRILPVEFVEFPEEITITFSDGTTRQQWCNDRLWKMYRGTSVGPKVLQSALMALEFWLFEAADAWPNHLDSILLRILRQSNNLALTAVVASLANAYPHDAVESLLVLLSSRECILIDKLRMVADLNPPSSWQFPQLDSRNEIHNEERKHADTRPHRKRDLEVAIKTIQMGSTAKRVQKILDQHREALPLTDEQNELSRIWRLSLHRMDLRRYKASVESVEVSDSEQGEEEIQQVQRVRFDPVAAEPDLESMISQSAAEQEEVNSRLALILWGIKTFDRESLDQYDPAKWKEQLSVARFLPLSSAASTSRDYGQRASAFIAAVCVRDHWDEMIAEEQTWCVSIVCSEIELHCDEWHQMARVQRYSMGGDRPTAWAISALIGRVTDPDSRLRVQKALVLATTHSNDEVRNYAAMGIGVNLWAKDRELAIRCVNLLASEAIQVEEQRRKQDGIPYTDRDWIDDIESEVAKSVRENFFETDGIPPDACSNCDPTTWTGSEAFSRMLAILLHAPAENVAIKAFRRVAETLLTWWDADDELRDQGSRRERPTEIEPQLTDLLARFLLRIPAGIVHGVIEPILSAVDAHPSEVSWIILRLIGLEDQEPNTAQFWSIWSLFAAKVKAASWLQHIDNKHPTGSDLMSAIFLSTDWKKEVRHWRSLEGYADRVHSLFECLPASSTIFEDYVCFLYHIGEQSLPNAFVSLAHKLETIDPNSLLRGRNTIHLLEILLQRHVYVRPRELKRKTDLRTAVLDLLDVLVENGSSAAFRMRDDFVTPLSAT